MNQHFMKLLIFASLAFNIGFDQYTKNLAEKHLMVWSHQKDLRQYQGVRDILLEFGKRSLEPDDPSFYLSFSLNYVRNQGAAWGMLSDWDDKYREPFFYLVIIVALLAFVYYYRVTPKEHTTVRVALQLLIAGALGNFIDRVHRGYVVDFIDVRWDIPFPMRLNFGWEIFPEFLSFLNVRVNSVSWAYAFPNFNWADTLISVAFVLMLAEIFWLEPRRVRMSNSVL
ncbi:MAG: signal peptidase II [Zetaproteobacteria bacterium]|nr:signal peptidase II [Zetaproteobacteria bacterium]